MLPFRPQEMGILKGRFGDAFKKVWVYDEGMEDRPGMHREHVFDFESGVRLLISKTQFPDKNIIAHVSASWYKAEPKSIDEAFQQIKEHFRLLGGKNALTFLGISAQGIPHWKIEDGIYPPQVN